jgi:hypothetical protein
MPVNCSALTALSRTPTTARVRCCQRRVAAHAAVPVVRGQPQPSVANRRETEGYGAKGPPSRAGRQAAITELSDGWQRLYPHDDTHLCHDYIAHCRGGVDPGGYVPGSP